MKDDSVKHSESSFQNWHGGQFFFYYKELKPGFAKFGQVQRCLCNLCDYSPSLLVCRGPENISQIPKRDLDNAYVKLQKEERNPPPFVQTVHLATRIFSLLTPNWTHLYFFSPDY
ncbi:hypothetical protein E2320_006261 [Naja naja]|nr:hypothetical protein E2320_006261 [Naja naja]